MHSRLCLSWLVPRPSLLLLRYRAKHYLHALLSVFVRAANLFLCLSFSRSIFSSVWLIYRVFVEILALTDDFCFAEKKEGQAMALCTTFVCRLSTPPFLFRLSFPPRLSLHVTFLSVYITVFILTRKVGLETVKLCVNDFVAKTEEKKEK